MMKREMRYWLWNAEELVFVILAVSVGMTVLFSLLEGGGNSLWMCGVFLLLCLGFWMAANGAQASKLLSVSLMFRSTRRTSFLGMQLMMLIVLAQTESVQLLLLLQPYGNRTLQGLIVCYTPVVFLFLTGIGYLISILEEKNKTIHKAVLTIFLGSMGGVVGFSVAMLAGESSSVGEFAVRADRILGGTVLVVAACIAAVIYMLGVGFYRKMAMNLDVQV